MTSSIGGAADLGYNNNNNISSHNIIDQNVTHVATAITKAAVSAIANNISNNNNDTTEPIANGHYDWPASGSWMFSNRDVPILIGAAAGAIGLIVILLLAALIWHCCQYMNTQKTSLDDGGSDSQRNSVGSRTSNLYINNPMDSSTGLIIGQKNSSAITREQTSLKRSTTGSSISHNNNIRDNSALQTNNTQTPIIESIDRHGRHQQLTVCDNLCAVDIDKEEEEDDEAVNEDNVNDNSRRRRQQSVDTKSLEMELNQKNESINNYHQRSHMYITSKHNNTNINNQINTTDDMIYKSKSLPWSQSNKHKSVTIDDEVHEFGAKVNFSKKRKNRMRNDSAAAIALNRSGGTDTNIIKTSLRHSHKDTDTLVDNEAVVVYDERTAL
ncbi:putative uncharacterized protein DDB_G0277255 isoform X2 [Oppia nitens]|uniref:putative uncharacterized protein DDB_G0277255 isoform X2 n=1 Tax=Oppia nitens TaxID=1686743 RepID=UPI0023DBFE79|nr:putative uncharacterized protein DDB_G0277255 isoform X2 [Oppia nitens]